MDMICVYTGCNISHIIVQMISAQMAKKDNISSAFSHVIRLMLHPEIGINVCYNLKLVLMSLNSAAILLGLYLFCKEKWPNFRYSEGFVYIFQTV